MHKLTLLDADAPNSGGGMNQVSDEDKKAVDQLREQYNGMRAEMAKIIIGQDKVVEQMLICILSRGHSLLMGVPGLAKTLMVNSLSKIMSLQFSRIQFTPDLLPADLLGTLVYNPKDAEILTTEPDLNHGAVGVDFHILRAGMTHQPAP